MKRCYLFVFSFFICSSVYSANDKGFLWEVSSALNTVYLMGSIHFADKSIYPLRKEIDEAFNRSDHLVVELDATSISADEYQLFVLEKGSYNNGKTIADVLSPETMQQLRLQLKELNVSYEAVSHYKPGILVLTLSAIQIVQMGLDPALGIDAYFLQKTTTQSDKEVIELETLEQQLNLFIDIPDGELLLKESLYSLDDSVLLMQDMMRFWKQGDEEKMNQLLFEDALTDYPEFSKIYDGLIYARNKTMTAKVDAMLQQQSATKEIFFVVVGTGHLIGEQGIVNALKKKGYTVKRR